MFYKNKQFHIATVRRQNSFLPLHKTAQQHSTYIFCFVLSSFCLSILCFKMSPKTCMGPRPVLSIIRLLCFICVDVFHPTNRQTFMIVYNCSPAFPEEGRFHDRKSPGAADPKEKPPLTMRSPARRIRCSQSQCRRRVAMSG